MDLDLTQEQQLVRETVREFALERVAPVAEELDRESRFPYELVAELAELGLMGLPIPEEYGGAGGDTVSYALAIEELTRIDSSVAIIAAHTSLGTMPIFLFGSEEQKREWLPDLASGRKLAAFGLTEPGAGSDAGNTRTTAELRDGSWVERLEDVHHERRHGRHLGRDADSPHRRERDLEHRRPERHARLRDLRPDEEARLEGVRHARALVPRCDRARGEPARPARRGLPAVPGDPRRGRISVAAMGVGLAQGAYDLAYAYAKERSSSDSRSRASRRCSSGSPTWRPRSRRAVRSWSEPRG